jgi:hypothetical protein
VSLTRRDVMRCNASLISKVLKVLWEMWSWAFPKAGGISDKSVNAVGIPTLYYNSTTVRGWLGERTVSNSDSHDSAVKTVSSYAGVPTSELPFVYK